MMEKGIYTGDYRKMEVPCQVTGTLVFWWQQYLGLPDIPIGTKLRLTYIQNPKGIHLDKAEQI